MDYYRLKVLNNKKKIIIVLVILGIVLCIIYYFFIYSKSDDLIINDEIVVENENEVVNTSLDMYVDLKGQVNKPGVYSFKLNDNARINDLINKAGGLTKDADTSTINLSKKLEDEMTIIIYSKNEINNYVKTQNELNKKLELCETKLKNNACINERSENDSKKVNINEASLGELITISGIGETRAKAIIEYRNKTKFKSIEDIKNVSGIGEDLFASIKENITV